MEILPEWVQDNLKEILELDRIEKELDEKEGESNDDTEENGV